MLVGGVSGESPTTLLPGVVTYALTVLPSPEGGVLHMFRPGSAAYTGCGEVYFSEIHAGAVKAWRRHSRITQRFAVPVGRVRVVMYDARDSRQVATQVLGRAPDEYRLLVVPPGVWYGFAGLADSVSLIANCTDQPYDPAEVERLPVHAAEIPYRWEKGHGHG